MSLINPKMLKDIPATKIVQTEDRRFINTAEAQALASLINGETPGGGTAPSSYAADKVTVADTDGLFVSADKNVENILKELFTYASNAKQSASEGKTLIATALVGKGQPALSSDTYKILADYIDTLKLDSTIKTTKLNVSAPYTKTVILDNARKIENLCTSVLEYVKDIGVVKYNCDFNNGDSANFIANDNIVFDGKMHLKTSFSYSASDNGVYTESEEIDISLFNDISNIAFNSSVILTAVPKEQLVLANGDIDLTGIETLDSILWTTSASNNSKTLLVISFDSGVTWKAYSGSVWNTVDVNSKSDISSKGMSKSITDALTVADIEAERNGSTKIRFAYFIDQKLVSDTVENDAITITVSMPGYTRICDKSKYDIVYDESSRTITYTFNSNGTYTVNYND